MDTLWDLRRIVSLLWRSIVILTMAILGGGSPHPSRGHLPVGLPHSHQPRCLHFTNQCPISVSVSLSVLSDPIDSSPYSSIQGACRPRHQADWQTALKPQQSSVRAKKVSQEGRPLPYFFTFLGPEPWAGASVLSLPSCLAFGVFMSSDKPCPLQASFLSCKTGREERV